MYIRRLPDCAIVKILVRTQTTKMAVMVMAGLLVQAHAVTYIDTMGTHIVKCWLPDTIGIVHGLMICGNGAGNPDETWQADCADRQAFCKNFDFGIIATGGFGNSINAGEGDTLTKAVVDFAARSRHPELVNASWLAMGVSNGGMMAWGFNYWKPERMIAYAACVGCCYENPTTLSAQGLQTPATYSYGTLDTVNSRVRNITSLFTVNRAKNGHCSLLPLINKGHEAGYSYDLNFVMFDHAVRARYPSGGDPRTGVVTLNNTPVESGWLGDITTWPANNSRQQCKIYPYAQYPSGSDPLAACWFIDEDVAAIYRAAVTPDDSLRSVMSANGQTGGTAYDNPARAVEQGTTITLQNTLTNLDTWDSIQFYNGAQRIRTITRTAVPTAAIPYTMSEWGAFAFYSTAYGVKNGSGAISCSWPVRVVARKPTLSTSVRSGTTRGSVLRSTANVSQRRYDMLGRIIRGRTAGPGSLVYVVRNPGGDDYRCTVEPGR
jgi:hypothetical protein